MMFAQSISAQTALLEFGGTYTLTDSLQQHRWALVTQDSAYEGVQKCQMKPLATAQQGGTVKLELPYPLSCGAGVYFKARTVRYNSANDYYWYGEIVDPLDTLDCIDGELMIKAVPEHGIFAWFSIGDQEFELIDLSGGVWALAEVKEVIYLNGECATENPDEEPIELDTVEVDTRFVCQIRVLVAYTEEAAAAVPSIQATIEASVDQFNQALLNSQVPNLELVLAGTLLVDRYNPLEADISEDLTLFENDQNVIDERDAVQADIAVLLEDKFYPTGQFTQALGVSSRVLARQINEGFAIVTVLNATRNKTFTHEVAHLIGAAHQVIPSHPNPNQDAPFPYCHGYKVQKGANRVRFSIMHTMEVVGKRILKFSNPNLTELGKPFGVVDANENYRQLRSYGCVVSGFGLDPELPAFDVNILPNTEAHCACEDIILSFDPSGTYNLPFQQYTWTISNDGINWSFLSNAASPTISMPCNEGERVYVRVHVTDDDATVAFDDMAYKADYSPNGLPCLRRLNIQAPTNASAESTEELFFKLLPNPLVQSGQIQFNQVVEQALGIQVLDEKGTLLGVVFEGRVSPGTYTLDLALDQSLPYGLYLLRLNRADGRGATLPFLFTPSN